MDDKLQPWSSGIRVEDSDNNNIDRNLIAGFDDAIIIERSHGNRVEGNIVTRTFDLGREKLEHGSAKDRTLVIIGILVGIIGILVGIGVIIVGVITLAH